MLQQRFDVPVVVDRIANALLAAKARIGTATMNNAMLFNIGFGTSAAFLVEANIACGAHSLAGRVAHLPSNDPRRLCSCGHLGCLNAAASGWAALAEPGEIHDEVASAARRRR